MADLSQDQWYDQLTKDENSVVLDVRTLEEVEQGIIPNAKHLDIYQGQAFIDALKQLDTSKSYYVYCRSGARSGQACAIMNQLGFEKAYNLKGGIIEWKGEIVSH